MEYFLVFIAFNSRFIMEDILNEFRSARSSFWFSGISSKTVLFGFHRIQKINRKICSLKCPLVYAFDSLSLSLIFIIKSQRSFKVAAERNIQSLNYTKKISSTYVRMNVHIVNDFGVTDFLFVCACYEMGFLFFRGWDCLTGLKSRWASQLFYFIWLFSKFYFINWCRLQETCVAYVLWIYCEWRICLLDNLNWKRTILFELLAFF